MGDYELLRHGGFQLIDNRFVRQAMRAVAAYAHRGIFFRDRQTGDDFGHVAMKVSVQTNEIGNAGKQANGLAHDVDGDGCVQWCEGLCSAPSLQSVQG